MTQTVALIVHQVMDAPDLWSPTPDSRNITNGYYAVAVDGSHYRMGEAGYTASEAERTMLLRAVEQWQKETGWQPPHGESSNRHPVRQMAAIDSDTRARQAHSEFERMVRSALKSFIVHNDANVFKYGVEGAIFQLENELRGRNVMIDKGHGKSST